MMAFRDIMGTIAELFQLLWQRKLWWLIPMVVLLLFFAGLIVLGSTTGVGPFIYTLF